MYQACINRYYSNPAHVGVKLNFLRVNGSGNPGYNWTAFKPYIIIGYTSDTGAIPNGSPGSIIIDLSISNADQALFPYEELAQSMMSANINGQNQTGFLSYANPPSGKEYLYYYYKYLNDNLLPENFYSFMAPHTLVKEYWQGEDNFETGAGVNYDWQNYSSRFRDLHQTLFKGTDKRFWYPPGIYTMVGNNAPGPNIDPYFAGFNTAISSVAPANPFLIALELELMY